MDDPLSAQFLRSGPGSLARCQSVDQPSLAVGADIEASIAHRKHEPLRFGRTDAAPNSRCRMGPHPLDTQVGSGVQNGSSCGIFLEMSMKRRLMWWGVGAFAICALAWLLIGQRVTVIAKGPVNLYDKPADGQVIKVLQPDETAPVMGCEDLKNYIVPAVEIGGRRAYVREGDYRLERRRVWDPSAGPVSFSCP